MKFSVSSSALLSLLATTGKVISNKNTLPILDYFLMELKGDQLKVTTSDLETTLVGQITVDNVESEGMIAAPAKQLLDSLKEFAEIPLTIDCNDQTFEIKLNWKSGSLSIPGASAVSYPALPALAEDKKELTFDVDTLVNGINKTIFATADDELRLIMNGVYINIESQSITFVATDAHKLVKYVSPIETEIAASFILPKKPANLLLFGRPGLGKTHLSAAIAREVSGKGFSVVYDTAGHIFERFEAQKFGRDEAERDVERVLNCDLLILDDLGTEMVTTFVQSALYQIINGRLLEKKSTIVSTNLMPEAIAQRYSGQIASRIEGEYQLLPFVGEDIRVLKKKRGL